jgi:acetyltransferase-like isoleucine patch superfamily enzyme
MILKKNDKPLRMIGIPQSTLSQEGTHFIEKECIGDFKMITPSEFLSLENKHDYQYLAMFSLNIKERLDVLNVLDSEQLDCFTYIHDSVIIYKDLKNMPWEEAIQVVGYNCFLAPMSSILLNSKIGNHCLIETYCLISHYSELKDNVFLHSGTMIAGRTIIGKNCMFNFKSATLNKLTICDDVEVGALSNVTKDITQPGRYIGSVARYAGERISFSG